ncbi:MAG: beta-ketoacyl synthase chain length factor [Paludibacteraceae bacterium]
MIFINAIASDKTLKTDIKELIPDPILRRRMSRIVKRGVSVGMECVQAVGFEAIDAIITATGFGCLDDSEKFLRNFIENDEQLLNPTPFIQSTFNTVGGQIGLLCKNHCYNMTYTHRGRSFESALLDAILLLDGGEAHNVLLGAFDETTPTQYKIMERMGLWRRAQAGESAYFFVLSDKRGEQCVATIDLPEFLQTPVAENDLRKQYGNTLIYNDYTVSGVFHTASAAVLFDAIGRLSSDKQELTLYNSYFGTMPTVLHIRYC